LILFFAVGLYLPAIAKVHGGPVYRCSNNLKQVGLAFRMWANDHNDRFPMEVSSKDGGARDFLDATNFYINFEVMSNELGSPRVLRCPHNKDRSFATNFTTDFNISHLSYFLGLDATGQMTNSFLSGDGNLTDGSVLRAGILEVTVDKPAMWTKKMHHNQGNIVFPDGSVRSFTNTDLRAAIQKTGIKTNRLAIP
jgi:hypothetical protein